MFATENSIPEAIKSMRGNCDRKGVPKVCLNSWKTGATRAKAGQPGASVPNYGFPTRNDDFFLS